MSAIPYLKFYASDWAASTRILTSSAKGVWIDLIVALWQSAEPGTIRMSRSAYARMTGLSVKKVMETIALLAAQKLCEYAVQENGDIQVHSPRIAREHADVIATSNSLSAKRSQAARNRWNKRQQADPSTTVDDAIAQQVDHHSDLRCQNQNENLSPSPPVGPSRPRLDQALAAAPAHDITPEEADTWWHGREANDWMKSTFNGGILPVGANWQADMKSYIQSMRQRRSKTIKSPPRSSFATSIEERRAAKAAREYPEPKREIPWL